MDVATDIQRIAFDPIVSGKDVFGRSRTGTGKSFAFLLPALQRFAAYRKGVADGDVSIVVVSPIKELSLQLADVARTLTSSGFAGAGGKRPFAVRTVIGKMGADDFARGKPCDMLVATPGVANPRKGGGLAKLLMTDKRAAARLANVRTMVLDEGDALTEGGFLGAIREIDSHVKTPITAADPDERYQILVFSATLPPDLETSRMMKPRMGGLVKADTVGHGHKAVGENVLQEVVVNNARYQTQVIAAVVRRHADEMDRAKQSGGDSEGDAAFQKKLAAQLSKIPEKFSEIVSDKDLLASLSKMKKPSANAVPKWKVLVFVSSAMYVDYIHEGLRAALPGAGVFKIHGKMPPVARSKASDAFRDCDRCVLVSTDASARGMDYKGITAAVQIGFTTRSEFLQRAGRVGRAGAKGYAAAIYDTAEADRALRKGCTTTDEMCIGDMVESGKVKVLTARAAPSSGSAGRRSSTGRSLLYDPDFSFKPSKAVNPRRVFVTWLGGVASNFKRVKIPPAAAVDWAERFAEGLGVDVDKKVIRKKLNV
nr:putative DEAD/DEAH-box RNA helicase [Oceanusvirus sp.]